MQLSKVIPPPASHFYHIANEIPVSNSILLQLNSYVKCQRSFFLAHVITCNVAHVINAIKNLVAR